MANEKWNRHDAAHTGPAWPLGKPLHALLRPPFSQQIPLDLRPIGNKSSMSLFWRWLRPWLTLALLRQSGLQQERIGVQPQRILWIYRGTPQIGDAMMDLSSRVLLRDCNVRVELLTDAHIAKLFAADDVFAMVHEDAGKLKATDYDLVILDSFKARCLEEKQRHFPSLPFVTMRGYFSGPEFNRTLFSFYRMRQLLGGERDLDPELLKPHLVSAAQDRVRPRQLPIGKGAVAFALGGAAASRTYEQWDMVIADLLRQGKLQQAVLLGSENASAMAERILAKCAKSSHVVNCVARYSLLETYEIMKRCDLVACCDGGLLHLANSAGLPTVALFDSEVHPDMRMTMANRHVALQSTGIMNDLPVAEVINAVEKSIAIYASSSEPAV